LIALLVALWPWRLRMSPTTAGQIRSGPLCAQDRPAALLHPRHSGAFPGNQGGPSTRHHVSNSLPLFQPLVSEDVDAGNRGVPRLSSNDLRLFQERRGGTCSGNRVMRQHGVCLRGSVSIRHAGRPTSALPPRKWQRSDPEPDSAAPRISSTARPSSCRRPPTNSARVSCARSPIAPRWSFCCLASGSSPSVLSSHVQRFR